ncbi:NEL-type E3 ubiquitin ligase domain-containing protein [Bordetella bronchialis]|uniref:NEL-type E3 ubiquitin ligase domain-containing protein n=1 Tax=Bordetella bronchialis TaxID=463025 RepID=UPI003CFFB40B
MHLPHSPIASPLASTPSLASPCPPPPAPPAHREPGVVNLAELLHAVVTGNPDETRLRLAEAHFRELHGTDHGAAALHRLRMVTQQYQCHPVLQFNSDALELPVLLAAPDDRPPATPAQDALRAAVAEVARSQVRWLSLQYFSVVAHTAMDGGTHARAQDPGVPGIADAGGPLRTRRWLERPDTVAALHPRIAPYIRGQQSSTLPLGTIVERWLDREDPMLAGRWNDIARDQPAVSSGPSPTRAFKIWLIQLMESHIHRNAATRDEVVLWLRNAAQPGRQALVAEALDICAEGTTMCRDNALLTWNRLKMLLHKHDAIDGRYAGRLNELCQLALATLRTELLTAIGQDKIIALHKENQRRQQSNETPINIDPAEIMLDYQVSLRPALSLPFSVESMHYPTLSALTPEDIHFARNLIARAEAESFHAYLMLDFSPFLAEVQRLAGPQAHRQVTDALHLAAADLPSRVHERLRALDLPADDDTFNTLAVQMDRELRYNAWLPHANRALASVGLMPLPPFGTASAPPRSPA